MKVAEIARTSPFQFKFSRSLWGRLMESHNEPPGWFPFSYETTAPPASLNAGDMMQKRPSANNGGRRLLSPSNRKLLIGGERLQSFAAEYNNHNTQVYSCLCYAR
jgi:hypothetical protein